MDPVTLGERVRALRGKKGWKQTELAARAGVTTNTLRGLERGTLDTRRPKFEAICDALGTTPEALLRADEPVTPEHPLLEGLNDDDLRMAQAYSRARTSVRLRVERLLAGVPDAGLALLDLIDRLDPADRAHIEQTMALIAERPAKKDTKKKA